MSTHESEGKTNPYQITVRFGNDILQAGFTAIPNLVLDHYGELGISASEMMFIIHVWQFWWTEKNPYPSLQIIADRMATSRRQVRRYTEGLKEKGLLRVLERHQPGFGQITSEYDFAPLIERVVAMVPTEKRGWTEVTAPPRTEVTEAPRSISTGGPRSELTPEEYTGINNTQRREDSSKFESQKTSDDDFGRERTNEPIFILDQQIINHNVFSDEQPYETDIPAVHHSTTPAAKILAKRAIDLPQRNGDSSRGRPPGRSDEREQLHAFLADFARELHDGAPLSSTITRVLRMFRESGLPRERWGDVLYEARAVAQKNSGQITTLASESMLRGAKNKMPYFLAVVENLIGLRSVENREERVSISKDQGAVDRRHRTE